MPHIHDKYDFVITVLLVHKGQVLLVHHPRYKRWLPVSGHIELSEDPEEALRREIREETGIDTFEILSTRSSLVSPGTKFLPTPNYLDVHEANPPHKHIGLTYFVRVATDKIVLSDEHESFKWFNATELTAKEYELSPAIVFYAQEALKAAENP